MLSIILLLALLSSYNVSAAGVDPRCKVTSVRTGSATKVACKMIDEYEEYEYESTWRTIKTCVRFSVDGGAMDPKFKAGDSANNYKGKYWCPTVADYTPADGGLNWGVCQPSLPAVCFPPATSAPVSKPTKFTSSSPTRPTTKSPTKFPTTGYPTRLPTTAYPTRPTTFAPTLQPTSEPTLSPTHTPTLKPTTAYPTRPTKKPTKTPTRKPTKKATAKPTKKPTRSPTKKPSKVTG